MQNKKERLKPLSLYGLDLEQALHAMLSVDPRKLKLEEEKTEEQHSNLRRAAKVKDIRE